MQKSFAVIDNSISISALETKINYPFRFNQKLN